MALTQKDGVVVPYVRGNPPTEPNNIPQFLTNELKRVEVTLSQLVQLVPQVSLAAPKVPLTSMIRYAKAPWNPLGTGDGWVRYNGTAWVIL